jgi:hypothetical protein
MIPHLVATKLFLLDLGTKNNLVATISFQIYGNVMGHLVAA